MELSDFDLQSSYLTVTSAGRWLCVAWLFVLGGVFGSFMNVVVFRLPRGMSLSHPGSQCPACGHAIRWYDNVPMLGWLRLGGRCRDCHATISARYPLVELLVATLSSLLAWAEAVIPLTNPAPGADAVFVVQLGPFAFHLLLICTLICAALIEIDGHVAPLRMLGLVLIVGLALGSIWPNLRGGPQRGVGLLGGVYDGLIGMSAGLLLAALVWPGWIGRGVPQDVKQSVSWVAELQLVGVFLGLQAVSLITVAGLALQIALWLVARVWQSATRIGWAGPLVLVTLVYLLAWPVLVALEPRWAELDGMALVVYSGATVAGLSIVLRFVQTTRERTAGL